MKISKSNAVNGLKLLIELSCESLENEVLFEQFHKMLIAISYEATDVSIDYERKIIDMNVVAEDSKGDFLSRFDTFMPTTISLNLTYEKLENFLKECIENKNKVSHEYYSLLEAQFFQGKYLFEKHRLLEKA